MSSYVEAFLLGNAAILGNVCMLPLYPGLFAMMAGRAGAVEPTRGQRWLGAVVLAGVLCAMIALGLLLRTLRTSFADVLPVALPILYGVVFVLGVAMILDRNPFARLTTTQVPILRNPFATAFVYGLLLGPLTLPCTGPLIISAFVLGGVSGTGALVEGLAYFVAFGLGFGWPLVLLPLLAEPVQRRFTGTLTRHQRAIGVASGVLLIAVAVIGLTVDILPNVT